MPNRQLSTQGSTRIDSDNMLYNYGSVATFIDNNLSTIVEYNSKAGGDIEAHIYFKYLKKKLGVLEKMKIDGRLKRLEKAFNEAVNSGQDVLAKKFLDKVVVSVKETEMFARGVKLFVDIDIVRKYKNKIKGGHISDTSLEDYTRIIPKNVIEKKKKVEDIFDEFIVYHYYNQEVEEKREKKQEMSETERARMKDPILFGRVNGSNRLYFIADWEDEYCDLTFDEMVDVLGCEEKDITLTKDIKL